MIYDASGAFSVEVAARFVNTTYRRPLIAGLHRCLIGSSAFLWLSSERPRRVSALFHWLIFGSYEFLALALLSRHLYCTAFSCVWSLRLPGDVGGAMEKGLASGEFHR